ncbi:unnamed protein product [Arabidopsis halleri]
MSQPLGRIAKISSVVKKQRLCFSELRSFSTAATPYLLFCETNYRLVRTPRGSLVDMNLYDPRKKERVKVPDQYLSEDLEASLKIGASRGWVGVKNLHDSTVRLTNIFNPCASVSSHKVITLPPLEDSKTLISTISFSASPDQQDCVVAAKSYSPFISLCRPGDSDWTRIRVPFFATKVMYSARDRKFYLHRTSEEDYEGPIDLNTSSNDFPQVSLYQGFPNSDIPVSRQEQSFVSTIKTKYLVESPSGDSFIVYWYNDLWNKEEVKSDHDTSLRTKPRAFVVIRQDSERGIGSYTEDIGDLCIFLGKSEAFCVSATDYPGLNPNSVYFARTNAGFGYYDLSSNTLHDVIDPPPLSTSYLWLAPLQ